VNQIIIDQNFMFDKQYFIYMMTNPSHTVLYTGVTGNLAKRLFEHQNKLVEGFTSRYNCIKLIYYEQTNDVASAIEREKEIKGWTRYKKEMLIQSINPTWMDLSNEVNA